MFKRILLSVLLLILFVVTFLAISFPIFGLFERARKTEVKGDIPRLFPILVIAPAQDGNNWTAQVIYKAHLDSFIANNKDYTFLIPEGQAKKLNEAIFRHCSANSGDYNSEFPFLERFKVSALANGRQLLEVEHREDDEHVNVGYYETDGKEIFPKFHKMYFGPGLSMETLPLALLANLVVWGAGWYLNIRYKRRRSPAA